MIIKLLHRGWYGIFPENSLESIEKAFLSNFHGIETDIQITKDDIWVLHHDDNLNKLFKLDNKMNFYNYNEIGNINWKDKLTEYKLPKLPSLIKLAKSYQKIVNLEMKVKFSEISKKNTTDFKSIIENYKENIIISSFNWDWYPWCLQNNFTFAHLIEENKNLPIYGKILIFSKNQINELKKIQKTYDIGVYTLEYEQKSDIKYQIIDPPK